LNIDMLIYTIGALMITLVTVGFVVWAFRTKQFESNDFLRYYPLEEDENPQ
jgi:cbb3-type cytochrome oxidase subunit 3